MAHDLATAELVTVVVGLLLVAAATQGLAHRIKLPFTVALVLVGVALRALGEHGPAPFGFLAGIEVDPAVILFVFLPALVFESAFNLDARQLRHNLAPVLTLAVPGLIISTAVIGLALWVGTPLSFAASLLLGAILSATDPVAVIALFKQLGAPKRLTILVEGESLFNDATALVAAKILTGVVVAGYFTWDDALGGVGEFLRVFLGGVVVGAAAGGLVGWALGRIESDPQIEIALTTVLAYLSFLLAEELLHVSGVMAVVAAGITMGGWGRAKISPSVAGYLEHFWEFAAFVANALIFLLVGLTVDLDAVAAALAYLPWVVLGMLASRAALIYGLMPLLGRLPGSAPVDLAYQTVMFWGGLRGAIALAIVLSLPSFPHSELFAPLVTGAVLFTLLVQGLSMEPLVRRLGLDRAPLADRMALLGRDLTAAELTLERVPELTVNDALSGDVARAMERRARDDTDCARQAIAELRRSEMGRREELLLLYLRAFSEEQAFYRHLYHNGHLSEAAYRELLVVLALQIDAIRYQNRFEHVHSHRLRRLAERGLYHLIERSGSAALNRLAEGMRARRIARDYEEVLGHYQGSGRVLESLDRMATREGIPADVVEEVRGHYQRWHGMARERLAAVAAEFPEFVASAQARLGQRLALLAMKEATERHVERGLLPTGVGTAQQAAIFRQLNRLRGEALGSLPVDRIALLRRVPSLRRLGHRELRALAARLQRRTVVENEVIASCGEPADTLFLVARGVVRKLRVDDGSETEIGVLLAGDYFGTAVLLPGGVHEATWRAVTPCILYQLRRRDVDALRHRLPQPNAAGAGEEQPK